jgi:hypothetical protein
MSSRFSGSHLAPFASIRCSAFMRSRAREESIRIRTGMPVADGRRWGGYRTWVKEGDPCEHETSGGESWSIPGVVG